MKSISYGAHRYVEYSDEESLLAQVVPTMIEAIGRGMRVVYITDERTCEQMEQALSTYPQASLGQAIATGALEILSSTQTYNQGGVFDPKQMIALINRVVAEATLEGYLSVVGIGEMSWIFDDLPGSDLVVDYEKMLNMLDPKLPIELYCAYNTTKFDPSMLRLMKRIHNTG